MIFRIFASAAAYLLLAGALPVLAQDTVTASEITGVVTYRQRSALPPDAVVQVRLEDVSRQDAPAILIAEQNIATKGRQVPIPYRLSFDPAMIDPAHTYHVRATISSGPWLIYSSTTAYPIVAGYALSQIGIMVEPMESPRTPLAPRFEGAFVYLADAGVFTECRTGTRYPVAAERDFAALERSYLAARTAPGTPVPVIVEGRFERRATLEGAGSQDMFIVEKFIEVKKGGICPAALPAPPLEGTYWKLIELKSEPVIVADGGREPHLILSPEGKLGGSGGCNSFFGTYAANPEGLQLKPGGATMMACPEPVMNQEQVILATLPLVTGYRIAENILELLGGNQILARFSAVYLK